VNPSWTALVTGSSIAPPANERRAIAERLGVIGNEWSVGVLEAALSEENDASVRDVVWRALLRLRSA